MERWCTLQLGTWHAETPFFPFLPKDEMLDGVIFFAENGKLWLWMATFAIKIRRKLLRSPVSEVKRCVVVFRRHLLCPFSKNARAAPY